MKVFAKMLDAEQVDASSVLVAMADAPKDGKQYARRNGAWEVVNATAASGTTGVDPATATEVNKDGESTVDFFVPFKYALVESSDVMLSVSKLEWRYPYAGGRIKKIALMATTPGDTKVSVTVDGASALASTAVTSEWVTYDVDVAITYNQKIYIGTTYSLTAENLHVRLIIEVGNAEITLIGEPEAQASVVALSASDITTVSMPTVDSLCQIWGRSAWYAQDSATGKTYIYGTDSNYFHLSETEFVNRATSYSSPIEYPVEGVKHIDTYVRENADGTYSNANGLVSAFNSLPIFNIRNCVGHSEDKRTVYFISTATTAPFYSATVPDSGTFKTGYFYWSSSSSFRWYILTEEGKVYRNSASGVKDFEEIVHPNGVAIKQLFVTDSVKSNIFVVDENNDVYAMGSSAIWQLGLSPTGNGSNSYTYSSLTYVGNFGAVKTIFPVMASTGSTYCAFLLLEDGRLYVTGKLVHSNTNTKTWNGFTVYYENYKFDFLSYFIPNTYVSVYAIATKLGDMPTAS